MNSERDMLLFRALRRNGRTTLTALSDRTHVPISTIYERLQQQRGTIIKRYTVLLDFQKIGYPVHMYFVLKAEKRQKQRVVDFLENHNAVNTVYKINNGFDVICEAFFENIQTAELFIEILEDKYAVRKIQSFYILEEIKKEEFFME